MQQKLSTAQKFDTPAPIAALLDIPAGRIQVIAAERADTVVEVRPVHPGKSRDVKAAGQIQVGYEDGVLRVTAPAAKNQYLGPSGAVEVTVQLPAGSRVEAKAAAAEFRGVGRLGDVVFDGGQGQVKIDEAGDTRLTVLDGDVLLGRLVGDAKISTQRGDLTIAEAHQGAVELTTQHGDITVSAARGISAALDAGTSYGRVSNSLSNGAGAGLTIRATTSYGDITARSL
ncbi:hypothetical protein DI272_38105 [Streptomyces sp. Act143]|uniref:DUF4097 family beta strand repeat-containing protein n=1 Tax=Streptomyces sp. Act143 TaxID=2200760 RepID=UPI000D67AE46|nr:DUF4097 family beta strand repeat-containing protein [Streptomyces sp. Act143]PWI19329.1 hypothetical protein DI272_38105 [Streptomyces sp. Act143]